MCCCSYLELPQRSVLMDPVMFFDEHLVMTCLYLTRTLPRSCRFCRAHEPTKSKVSQGDFDLVLGPLEVDGAVPVVEETNEAPFFVRAAQEPVGWALRLASPSGRSLLGHRPRHPRLLPRRPQAPAASWPSGFDYRPAMAASACVAAASLDGGSKMGELYGLVVG